MTEKNVNDINVLDDNPLSSLYDTKHSINLYRRKLHVHVCVCPRYSSFRLQLEDDDDLAGESELHLYLKQIPYDGDRNYKIPMFKPHDTRKEKHHLVLKRKNASRTVYDCKINDAPIGCYYLFTQDGQKLSIDDSIIFFCIVFNPWSKHDSTYINNNLLYDYGDSNADKMWKIIGIDARNEYVINDTVYYCSKVDPCKCKGSIPEKFYSEWELGIGDPLLLLFTLGMISGLSADEREDVTKVSRIICALTNQNDNDNGLIYGKWNGNYEDGKEPDYWTDTISILKDYLRVENDTYGVEYGQCWVFALVLSSLLRSIGIPSRCIINFNSGHDTGDDGVCDKDEDSCWNFHYWVESWMRRDDLDDEYPKYKYNGWQVIDSTPQEASKDRYYYGCNECAHKFRYVLGPSPVLAVKHRKRIPYDSKFVCGEVNLKGFGINTSCPHTVVYCKDKYYNLKVKCNYIDE